MNLPSPPWYLRPPWMVEPSISEVNYYSKRNPTTKYYYYTGNGTDKKLNLSHKNFKKTGIMTTLFKNRKRTARVRTGSNPLLMGSCFSNFKNDGKEDRKIVRVQEGLLEGTRLTTSSGYHCDVFLGIPYAKPPVGDLRFEKPQPAERWDGIRKCSKYPNRAVQKEMPWDKALPRAPMSEDCLYANVFAPQIREDKKYPVLFYIHGGGWLMDSAERYTPKSLCRLIVSRDVIVVTFHYRLGFLGFLSTGDEICPGNNGLYDMLAALRWTYNNISSFGGDNQNITLSGQSAGAAAADLLSISPLAKGLFARKIVMGGNSYCHWATTEKKDIREYCKKKAIKMGWKPMESYPSTKDESYDIFEFYKSLPSSKLGGTMWFSKVIFTECILPLAPVVDGHILPDDINTLHENQSHVPSMVGGGEHEALLFYAIGLFRGSDKEINSSIAMLSKKTGISLSKIEAIVQKLYGDSPALRGNSKLRKKLYVDIVSDVFANYGNYQLMRDAQKEGVECYAYSFDHQSSQMYGVLRHVVPFTGGTHTSDINYLFNANFMSAPLGMNKTDKKVSELTADLWTNFVKFGSPNGMDRNSQLASWEPVSTNGNKLELYCMKEHPEMKSKPWVDRMEILENNYSDLFEEKHVFNLQKRKPSFH